jgi:CubicO group peptidase (beta-lactamase class C family)
VTSDQLTDLAAPLSALLQAGVDDHVYPGAAWAVGDAEQTRLSGAAGLLDPADPAQPMTTGTIFDVASLTKIMAVWAGIGMLWETGKLALEDTLAALIPDQAAGYPLGQVTVRQLLTHTAGVPLRANLEALYGTDPAAIRAGVLHEDLHRPPGEAVEYTDRAALITGYLLEALAAAPLDVIARDRVWAPLGMHGTRFGPLPPALATRCAPTEADQQTGIHLKGTAHDFSARLLGGTCGIAGVFSTLDDTSAFLRYLLDAAAQDPPAFGTAWISESLQVHTGNLDPARGLSGLPAPGTSPAEDIYLHYGFTGTGLWISRKHRRWAVLLTNKIYYTRDREPLTSIRNAFRELIFN